MWLPFLRTVRHVLSIHRRDTSPRQLAAGLALGIALGLVPKGNLSAMVLTCMLFGSRANLGVGVIAAFVVSLIAPSFDFLLHATGSAILGIELVQRTLGTLFRLPLIAWSRLDNTVVMGGVTIGMAQLGVTYCLGVRAFRRIQTKRTLASEPHDDQHEISSPSTEREAA